MFDITRHTIIFDSCRKLHSDSSWIEHIPFAFYLISCLEPGVFVELGVDKGTSFNAFCQAIKTLKTGAKCYGVDTWQGDEHAGFYDEAAYNELLNYQQAEYGDFAHLLKMKFDEAVVYFSDGSVDLLHIDGYHTYEAVKHDFESWLPKMSDKGVVILHDTVVRERNFGVWRLWEEVSLRYPSFEFKHEHGLGVLAVGRDVRPEFLSFLSMAGENSFYQNLFLSLGKRMRLAHHGRDLENGEIIALRQELERRDQEIQESALLEQEVMRLRAVEESVAWRAVKKMLDFLDHTALPVRSRRSRMIRPILYRLTTLLVRSSGKTVPAPAMCPEPAKAQTVEYYGAKPGKRRSPIRKMSFLITPPPFDPESKRYRVYNLIEELNDFGISCIVVHETDRDITELLLDSDILVVFRVAMSPEIAAILDRMKEQGIPVVFDIDDLIFDPDVIHHLDGLNYLPEEMRRDFVSHVYRWRDTLLKSDYVTCTTDGLADAAQRMGRRAFVIPNTINTAQYTFAEEIIGNATTEAGRIKIGYFSGSRTHNKDFQEVSDALYDVMRDHPSVEFHLVGYLDLEERFLKFGKRVVIQPYMPEMKYFAYKASMDITIAPLELGNPFTDSKSELKIFESALVGVPTVASPTASYRKCITDGIDGFLARTREEWYKKLSLLIEDPSLRRKMGESARLHFIQRFYIKNRIADIVKVYEEILDHHHLARPASPEEGLRK